MLTTSSSSVPDKSTANTSEIPLSLDQTVTRPQSNAFRQQIQTNWARLFSGSLHSTRPTALEAIRAPDDADLTTSSPSASKSLADLLNSKRFTVYDELDGDGDNLLSMQRKCHHWKRPSTEQVHATVPYVSHNLERSVQPKGLVGGVQPNVADSMPVTEYAESFRRSRTSSLSFKRKYKPMQTTRATSEETAIEPAETIDDDGSHRRIYESRVDQILKIMNTAESDYKHRIRVTSKSSQQPLPQMQQSLEMPGTTTSPDNYSFYALVFMVASNLVGFTLSLSYQVLLFLKLNADRFLHKSWVHCRNVSVLGTEHNIVTLVLMLPLILVVLLLYLSIWAAFNVNRLLLTTVPDRLADMINFNIQIVN